MPDSPAPTISTSTCSDVMVASRRIGLAIRLAVIATNYSAVGVKCNRQTKAPDRSGAWSFPFVRTRATLGVHIFVDCAFVATGPKQLQIAVQEYSSTWNHKSVLQPILRDG